MNYKVAVFIFSVIMVILSSKTGFNEESIGSEKEIFLRNDIPGIANYIMENKISVSKTMSRPTILQLSSEQQTLHNKNYELMKILFEKIKGFETTQSKADIDTISIIVDDYVTIGNAVSSGGGYVNYLMGDVLYGMSLSRLAFFLLENPARYDEVERIWRKLKRPNFEISNLADMLEDEFGITGTKAELEKHQGSLLGKSIVLVRQGTEKGLLDITEVTLKTSHILEDRDIRGLLRRMAGTERVLESSIPGMIEFLRRGGKIDDLQGYTRDVRPFLSLMGDSRKLFGTKLFGERLLCPYSLIDLLEFEEGFKSNFFYQRALE